MKNVISFVKSYRVSGYEDNVIMLIVSTVYSSGYYEVISRVLLNMCPIGVIYGVLGSRNTLKSCDLAQPYNDKIEQFHLYKPLLYIFDSAFTSYIRRTIIFPSIVNEALDAMRSACIGGNNSIVLDCRSKLKKEFRDTSYNEILQEWWHYPLPEYDDFAERGCIADDED